MTSSRSRSDTITSVETTQTSENLNIQDVEGITIAGVEGGEINVISTDHNAVGSATELARRSVEAGETIAQESLDFTRRIFETGIGSVGEAFEGARGAVSDTVESAFNFAREATERQQESLSETVGALNLISKEQNTSADQRIAEISADAQKNLIILVGIVGVAAIAFLLFRG